MKILSRENNLKLHQEPLSILVSGTGNNIISSIEISYMENLLTEIMNSSRTWAKRLIVVNRLLLNKSTNLDTMLNANVSAIRQPRKSWYESGWLQVINNSILNP